MTTPTFPLRAPPGTTHSPAPWHIHGQSESGRYITVKAANGRTVARVPFNAENTPLADFTDAQDALLTSLAPELLAQLAKVASGTHAMLVGMFCLGGISEAHAIKLADQRLQTTNDLITKARGQ